MSAVIKLATSDAKLRQLVRDTGMPCSVVAREALSALPKPVRAQPAVLVVDLRGAAGIPPALAAAEAQASDDGRAARGDDARSGADARSDARRRERIRHRPVSAPSCRRPSSGWWAISASGRAGRGLRLHRRQGRRRRDDGGRERRDARWRRASPDSTLLIDLNVACGDAAVFLGDRAAVLGHGRARERAAARRRVLQRPRRPQPSPGSICSARPDGRSPASSTPARIRALLEFASQTNRFTVLDVPRSDADGARFARERHEDRAGRQPGARHGAQRQPHGRDAAAALRPDAVCAGAHAHRPARRDRPRRRGAHGRASRSRTRSRATTGWRCRR